MRNVRSRFSDNIWKKDSSPGRNAFSRLTTLIFIIGSAEAYSIGSGTQDDPYQHPRQLWQGGASWNECESNGYRDGIDPGTVKRRALADVCSAWDKCLTGLAPFKPRLTDLSDLNPWSRPRSYYCVNKNGNPSDHPRVILGLCSEGYRYDVKAKRCIGKKPDCATTDQPVHISTGNKSIVETDFSSQGNSLLMLKRTWQSQNRRWRFSFRYYLVEKTSPAIEVSIVGESDWVIRFYDEGGAWEPDADIKDALVEVGSGWLYTQSNGDKHWFDSAGRLIRMRGADGRGVAITYPSATTMVVADDYGQSMTLTLDASGRVVSMTDPDLAVYGYSYRNDGNLEFVTFPADDALPGAVREYHYDDPNDAALITAITDENGDLFKTITYDSTGRATSSGLADGSVGQSNFDHSRIEDPVDPRVTVTNALGKKTIFHLEEHFNVVRVAQVEGVAHGATGCLADVQSKEYYPENGWVKRKTDKAGNVTYYEYYTGADINGLVSKRVEGLGSPEERTFEFEWYPTTRQKKQERLVGSRQTDYTYHPNGKLYTRIEADLTGLADVATRTWTTTYTYHDSPADTRVATITVDGPRTDVADSTVTEYNAQGFMIKSTNALGYITQYQNHNGRGQPGRIIDANGIITDMTYTARGWLDNIAQDVGGLNAVTDLDYDNVGQLTGTTLADGVYLTFEFDDGHRMEATQNSLGERIEYALDAAGNQDLTIYKDGVGTVTQTVDYDFDGLSRLWKAFGSYGQQTHYTYDGKGHLTTIDDGVNPATSQVFDAHNRLEQVTDADNEDMFVDYDAEDRVDKVTDQRGLITDYIYDGFGNLQTLISPDTGTTRYDYDAAGNRIKQTDARSVVRDYTYDALNRLNTLKYPTEPGKDIIYLYDNWLFCSQCNGRLAGAVDSSGTRLYFYDALGRVDLRANNVVVPGGGTVSMTTDFDFNKAGRLEQVTYPRGQVVKYGFDTAGQVDAVSYHAPDINNPGATIPTDIATSIKYQPFGAMKEAAYHNGLRLNRVYDQDGRLDSQSVTGVQDLDYDYDGVNNVEDIDNLIDDSRDESFTYDNLNRLETADGRYGAIVYGYDAVGNRKSRTITRGALTITEIYTYPSGSNKLDQIDISDGTSDTTRKFEYDDAGNLTGEKRAGAAYMKPVYDATNRMESVSQ